MGWGQDWGTAPYGDPGAPLLTLIEGFEHKTTSIQSFSSPVNGLAQFVEGTAQMSFPAGRNGACLQVAPAGAACRFVKQISYSTVFVVSFYIKTSSAAAVNLFSLQTALFNNAPVLNLNANGSLRLQMTSAVVDTAGTYNDGAWHRIDICANLAADPWVVQWQVDGVAQETIDDPAISQGLNPIAIRYITFGTAATGQTFTCQYDDVVASDAIGTYPIGEHSVGFAVPTSDGTHAAGTNVMERQDAQDIGAVTAFNVLSIWPATVNDYVRQFSNGASNYAEVNFADTVATSIWGVSAIAALFSAGTAANNGITRIVDSSNTTLVDVYTGDMSETSLHYRTAIVPVPSGGWTPTILNGLKARVGFSSDAAPDPHWASLMLQYAIEELNVQSLEDMDRISQTPAVFTPSTLLHPSATVGLISRVGVVFAPKIRKTMLLPFINQAGVTFAPSQYTQKVIDAGAFEQGAFDDDTFQMGTSFYISSTVQLFAPTFPANPQTVTFGVDSAFQDDAFQDNAFQDSASVGGSIIRTGTAFAPALGGQGVSPYVSLTGTGGWDSGEITWDDPVTEWDAAGLGGQIDQSGHVFTPQFEFTQILLGLIDQSPVLFAPSPGAFSIGPMPFINRSGFAHTPQVNESITVGLISNVGTTFTPVVSAPQTVELDFIDQTPVLFAFQLNTLQVELPLISRVGFTYTPTVTENVTLDLITSVGTPFEPKFNAISLGVISNAGIVFEPSLVFNEPDVEVGLISQTPVVFEPPLFLIPFQQTIRLDETAEQFIDNAGHVFQFVSVEVAPPQSVYIGLIVQRGVALALRVYLPTRPTIVLHARYDPVSVKHARYDPVILKHAQNTRQG